VVQVWYIAHLLYYRTLAAQAIPPFEELFLGYSLEKSLKPLRRNGFAGFLTSEIADTLNILTHDSASVNRRLWYSCGTRGTEISIT
jgi:hypothetical protein